jgi:hypothetical protein
MGLVNSISSLNITQNGGNVLTITLLIARAI